MVEERAIEFGALYHLHERFRPSKTGSVMKITGIGNTRPQRIYGIVWFKDGSTAQSIDPDKLHTWDVDHAVFACEIGSKLTDAEVIKLRERHLRRVTEFWGNEKAPVELESTG